MSDLVKPSDFSPHLFWDVDRNNLDWEKNKAQIIQRVPEYGLLRDWQLIQKIWNLTDCYVCKLMRSPDRKSLVLIATPLQGFR